MKKFLLFICALLIQFQCIGAINQIENPYILKIRSTTSFDLPKNTPGYQGLQAKKMKYGYKDCLHVIVPRKPPARLVSSKKLRAMRRKTPLL